MELEKQFKTLTLILITTVAFSTINSYLHNLQHVNKIIKTIIEFPIPVVRTDTWNLREFPRDFRCYY